MRIVLIVAIVLVVLFAGFVFCLEKVPVDKVGVKVKQLEGGVIQKDYAPGYVFAIPGLHRLELLDPTLQFFTIAKDGDTGQPVRLRGNDQYITKVDVTIVYRIKPGEAHKALVRHGRGEAYKTRLDSFARKNIWDQLANLDTEDFYNTERRRAGAKAAMERMNEDLDDQHLEVIDVLVRNIEYDPDFEEKLLDKQLLDQQQQLEDSRAKLETQKEITEKIKKETEAKVVAIEQEKESEKKKKVATNEAEVAKILADAELEAEQVLAKARQYQREKKAEADLLMTQAEAKGDKALAAAYAGHGGELYLTRQMVENLELGKIEVNTNRVNPFDVGEMLSMLGLEAEDRAATATAAEPDAAETGTATSAR